MSVVTIDCEYMDHPGFAAAYLVLESDRAAFVETNTNRAVPRLLEALRAHGRDVGDVELVVITHVHLDHAGGASSLMEACPHATLLAHPRAARHVIDPSKLIASAREVYGAEAFEAMYGEIRPVPAERVRVMEDGDAVTLGGRTLTFLHTRGHADHHACIVDSGIERDLHGRLVRPRLPGAAEERPLRHPLHLADRLRRARGEEEPRPHPRHGRRARLPHALRGAAGPRGHRRHAARPARRVRRDRRRSLRGRARGRGPGALLRGARRRDLRARARRARPRRRSRGARDPLHRPRPERAGRGLQREEASLQGAEGLTAKRAVVTRRRARA
ncbi:MAG: MBL fold metallo-hydrolase [Sandaracinaceae bacterium]|nr:MBL fold metallo-hydrolase [Sandaracinaceae bacterium]